MLAFSSCWNNSRHTDGESMIEEIVELGFSNIELSHGMTIAKLPGIKKAYQRGIFTCSGVHNYFPSPVEVMTRRTPTSLPRTGPSTASARWT